MIRDKAKEYVCDFRIDALFISGCKLRRKFYKVTYEDIGGTGTDCPYHITSSPPLPEPTGFDPTSTCDPATDMDLTWNSITEGDEDILPKALAIIDQGKSLQIRGFAGTGKTTVCKALVEHLEKKGHRCQCVALTHVASRLINKGMIIQA